MSLPDLNGELGAIVTIISALAAAIVSIVNAIKSRTTHRKVDQLGTLANEASAKMDVIKTQTNGDRDRMLMDIGKKDLTIQELRISLMRKDIELEQYKKPVIRIEDKEAKE